MSVVSLPVKLIFVSLLGLVAQGCATESADQKSQRIAREARRNAEFAAAVQRLRKGMTIAEVKALGISSWCSSEMSICSDHSSNGSQYVEFRGGLLESWL